HRHPKRHGRHLRPEPPGRAARRAAAGVGQPGGGRAPAALSGGPAAMTEAGWLACADPEPMLRSLSRRPRRKAPGPPGLDPGRFRAFAAACCRRVWGHLTDYLRVVLEHLERYPHQAAPDTLTLAGQICRAEAEGLGSRWALEMATILHGPADYR